MPKAPSTIKTEPKLTEKDIVTILFMASIISSFSENHGSPGSRSVVQDAQEFTEAFYRTIE